MEFFAGFILGVFATLIFLIALTAWSLTEGNDYD